MANDILDKERAEKALAHSEHMSPGAPSEARLSAAIRHYLNKHLSGEMLDRNHFAAAALAHGDAIRHDRTPQTAIKHGIRAYLHALQNEAKIRG